MGFNWPLRVNHNTRVPGCEKLAISAGYRAIFLLVLILLQCPFIIAKECTQIRVNGVKEWFPISFYADNQYTGIAYEVTKEVFDRLGVETMTEEPQPWSRLLVRLEESLQGAFIAISVQKYFVLATVL